jgi:hypothetical protein
MILIFGASKGRKKEEREGVDKFFHATNTTLFYEVRASVRNSYLGRLKLKQ